MKTQTEKIKEEGMKNPTQTEVKEVEETEKKVTHHEKHKHSGEKNNPKEIKSEVK